MLVDNDSLYDLVLYVEYIKSNSFEKFLYDNNLFDYGITEAAHGFYIELNRLTDEMCSYILFTSDYTKFIKMKSIMDV